MNQRSSEGQSDKTIEQADRPDIDLDGSRAHRSRLKGGLTRANGKEDLSMVDAYPGQRQCMEVTCGNSSTHVWGVGEVGHYLFHAYDFHWEFFVVIYPPAGVSEPAVVVEVYIRRRQRPETGNADECTTNLPKVGREHNGKDRRYLSWPPVACRTDENVAISPSDCSGFVGCSCDVDPSSKRRESWRG